MPAEEPSHCSTVVKAWHKRQVQAREIQWESLWSPGRSSFALLFPESYREIMRKRQALPAFETVVQAHALRTLTYGQMLAKYRDAARELGHAFESVAERARDELRKPPLSQMPDVSARRHLKRFTQFLIREAIRFDISDRNRGNWRRGETSRRFYSFEREYGHLFPSGNYDEPWKQFVSLVGKLRSQWGEIRVALLVSKLQANDITLVEACKRGLIPSDFLKDLKASGHEQVSVDLIYDVRLQRGYPQRHWAEVKTLTAPFDPIRTPGDFPQTMDQLRRLKDLRDRYGKGVQLVFVALGGASRQGIAAVEALDFHYLGPVVD